MKNQKELIEIAKSNISNEIKTLSYLSENLDSNFIECLTRIESLKGKLVFSGIGKSGIIAQKIASSFTSIHIPSIYIHPCDALHGELGLITNDDIIFLLSNSGETEEVITFVQNIKKRSCQIISITSKRTSSIGKLSDLVLELKIEQEDPIYNIIPMSSIIAQCAIGDALIVAMLKLKHFTKEDFTYNHPGGNIGKS